MLSPPSFHGVHSIKPCCRPVYYRIIGVHCAASSASPNPCCIHREADFLTGRLVATTLPTPPGVRPKGNVRTFRS
jgi:hypothetical protein